MKLKRWLLVLILGIVMFLSGCWGSWFDYWFDPQEELWVYKSTVTIHLQPTHTARSTPQGVYCIDATSAGARIKYTFQEILPCLDTVEKVSEFMQNNMMFDGAYDTRERGINEYAPAWLVYQRGVDDCDGHAILQCYFLEMNGGDAYMLGMGLPKASGHNVCAVDTRDGIIVLDNMGGIVGPFDSFESAALHYIQTDEWFGMIRASQITEIVTGDVRSALSWIVVWNPATPTP